MAAACRGCHLGEEGQGVGGEGGCEWEGFEYASVLLRQ
jgi:hypothetical protein